MSTTTEQNNETASAPAPASAPAKQEKQDRSYRTPLEGGPKYATEHIAYEPRGFDPKKHKFVIKNWPAKSLWSEMVGGDECLADYLSYCAREHCSVRGFKKARESFAPEAELDIRSQKSPDWGKEAEKPALSAADQIAAMSPEDRKAFLLAQLAAMEQS